MIVFSSVNCICILKLRLSLITNVKFNNSKNYFFNWKVVVFTNITTHLFSIFIVSFVFYIMACNGLCVRYKAKRNSDSAARYTEGQKRCTTCEIFIRWDNAYCPCCNYKLRTRSFRGLRMREIQRESHITRY